MKFLETQLTGVWVVQPERLADERGHFARTFCVEAFQKQGLATEYVQSSSAFTRSSGTLRGLHYQDHPQWETKLVRCTQGEAFVVAVNVDPASPQHKQWHAEILSADNGHALYVPTGFAQGYQTLQDNTELLYQMTVPYDASLARGFAWNDPAFQIDWPLTPSLLSPKDRSWGKYS